MKALDPMDYYRQFGVDKIGLTASDGMCSTSEDMLHGVLQTEEKHGPGRFACAYLTPEEMRSLAGELIKLAAAIEKEAMRAAPSGEKE